MSFQGGIGQVNTLSVSKVYLCPLAEEKEAHTLSQGVISHKLALAKLAEIKKCLQIAYADYGTIKPPLLDDKQSRRLTLEESYIKLTLITGRPSVTESATGRHRSVH